jgi:aspartate aminotransferase
MLKIQSHSTSNANSIAQKAAIEAAAGPQDSIASMLGEYRRRRDWLIPALGDIKGIRCQMPEGAFYAFPDVRGLLNGSIKTTTELSSLLLDKAHVVVTAGSAFGAEGYIRISYANSLEAIQKGVDRIRQVAATLV